MNPESTPQELDALWPCGYHKGTSGGLYFGQSGGSDMGSVDWECLNATVWQASSLLIDGQTQPNCKMHSVQNVVWEAERGAILPHSCRPYMDQNLYEE